MNKKENEQLKKIDQLDKQLDNTINKIGVTKVEPIKISKKKLALFMLIPFLIACVLSAVTSFLIIDPFHWYTKSRLTLEQKQEKQIKQIKQKFADLTLATAFDSSNTIADLLWEMKHSSNINDIVQSPNEIIDITSKKGNESKLSSTGEEVNLKILVRNGSLEKEIDIKLKVIVDNQTVKQVNGLVKYPQFLSTITSKIVADGVKRVSNLLDVIKTVIDEDDRYKAVFKDIKFDIVNDKDDDEIIASGLKTLNVNFNFTENKQLINSSVKLNVDLPGKSRKEINQDLADKFKRHPTSFSASIPTDRKYYLFGQNVFANESTYKELIDELILFAPKNNFYHSMNILKYFDDSDSKLSVDFTIVNTASEKLDEVIKIDDGKEWEAVDLRLQFFVGNSQERYLSSNLGVSVVIMKKEYAQREFFLYLSKLMEQILQGLSKFEFNSKVGDTYGKLNAELKNKIDIWAESVDKPNKMYDFEIRPSIITTNGDLEVISSENLYGSIYFDYAKLKIPNLPKFQLFWIYLLLKKIDA